MVSDYLSQFKDQCYPINNNFHDYYSEPVHKTTQTMIRLYAQKNLYMANISKPFFATSKQGKSGHHMKTSISSNHHKHISEQINMLL